jgi:formate/nitrite transporter FocA (FNT family)
VNNLHEVFYGSQHEVDISKFPCSTTHLTNLWHSCFLHNVLGEVASSLLFQMGCKKMQGETNWKDKNVSFN